MNDEPQTEQPAPSTAVQLRAATLIASAVSAWDQRAKPFNDQVTEAVKHLLQTSEEFALLMLSKRNSETVEGTILDDTVAAARMLRESAPEDSSIAEAKTNRLRKAMGVAMRRLGLGRRQLPDAGVPAE